MKRLTLLLLLAAATAVLAAGCGGSSSSSKGSVSSSDVAVVKGQSVSRSALQTLIHRTECSYTQRKQPFPKVGSPAYLQLRQQDVQTLVQQTELVQKAKQLGVQITSADVTNRLAQIKKQFFGGNEKRYRAQIKANCLNDKTVRSDIVKPQILSEKIANKVTAGISVSDQDVKSYYEKNKQQYQQTATRNVRHILIACTKAAACKAAKQKADALYRRIKQGGDFATLAKRYSDDKGTAVNGGKYTAQKGRDVPPFDNVAFSLGLNEVSKPVKTQFGYHIIQALAPVKQAAATPLAQVQAQIRQQLLQTKKNAVLGTFVDKLRKEYAGDISYAKGFSPPSTATTGTSSTSSSSTSTGR